MVVIKVGFYFFFKIGVFFLRFLEFWFMIVRYFGWGAWGVGVM